MKRWIIAMRPWSFPVSAAPVILTATYLMLRGYAVDWLLALWALVGNMLFHAAGNLISDYYDFRKGVDTNPEVGGSAITGGSMTAHEVHVFGLVMLAVASVNGLLMMLFTGWELLLYGAVGAFLAAFYPWFKFHALGDLDILFTFGIIPTLGTAYAILPEHPSIMGPEAYMLCDALWVTLAFATVTVAVLHANNSRDAACDGNAKIRTFAMLIGARASRIVYYLEVLMPVIWVSVCLAFGRMPWPMLCFALPTLVPAIGLIKRMSTLPAPEKVATLDVSTAQYQLINTFLLTAGFIVCHFVL